MIFSLRRALAALCAAAVVLPAVAAPPLPAARALPPGEILLGLQRLRVLGRVLYVAAHPDDENTTLLAAWTNGSLYDAGYLSLTRGDGGQNLIGPELREALGVIRTQELLAARRTDHARQFFSRANDFGFSKNAAESLRIWDRDTILSDAVRVIRRFRPDAIVTRFEPDDMLTHGHHSASAQLAREAFRAAADPARFPDAGPAWAARRITWNTSPFFFRARNLPFNPADYATSDAGGYQPLLGRSFPEISAASRSMHKSQGFGVTAERGGRTEYFKLLDGAPIPPGGDLLEGVNTTWARVPGADGVGAKIDALVSRFSAADPAASAPALLELRRTLVPLAAKDAWAAQKLAETDTLLAACLGLRFEAVVEKPTARPGDALALQLEATNRSAVPVRWLRTRLSLSGESIAVDADLPAGQLVTKKATPILPASAPFSSPYWLRDAGTPGAFAVADPEWIGEPENPPAFPVEITASVGGHEITWALEARHRSTDPVDGEVNLPLVVTPPIFVNFARDVIMFADASPRVVEVRVTAAAAEWSGMLKLVSPEGWQVQPEEAAVELSGEGKDKVLKFTVTPPAAASEGKLEVATWNRVSNGTSRKFNPLPLYSRQRIKYPHIPPQTLMPRAEARIVRADIALRAHRIGYLPGAGDAIPASLAEIGAEVTTLRDEDVAASHLAGFDTVILGVRAFNMQERIAAWSAELRAYAAAGGTVVVQYNTLPAPPADLFPFSLRVSRDRVTDEEAPVRILAPEHPALTSPNRLGPADFAGWVQERGLYFPTEWAKEWTPLVSMNDPGEKPLDGGVLVAPVGRGHYVYTSLSWFRQLPAGVPGAYRFFANLVSLGKGDAKDQARGK